MAESNTTKPTDTFSDPLSLHNSDTPGLSLVNFKLEGHNYGQWSRSMHLSRSAKNKLGFVDGSVKTPSSDDSKFPLWQRCNDMVLSWILHSLHPDIASSVLYAKTAAAVWTDLRDRFSQSNDSRIYQIRQEIVECRQGQQTMQVNLVGGYYDAGDHVKFGLPMAFTVTMLSWGAIEFRKEITDLAQMGQTLRAIRWGTDYFMKAHPQPNVLWGQVGDGDSDHYCWERPEDMTTPRTAYKIDENHPGSDLAGETAAALASAAIAFQPYNSSYSALLLAHAKQLFTFADRFRGLYDESIGSAKNFYTSSGYSDELLWAAAWLYQATNEEYYLKYVVDNAVYMGGTGWAVKEFSWDNKYAGVQILLSKVLLEGKGGAYTSTFKQYQAKADYFACACLQKNEGYNVHKTPGGLLYVREWNNLQYVTSASFLLAVYSEYLSAAKAKLTCPEGQIQPQELLNFAKSQADYILGKNPKSMSYIVGFGSKYPVHVHHRGASIPAVSVLQSVVGCVQGFETWYHRPEANPNVIYGALVGGPDQNDNFSDDRSSYEETEPTLSGSGPLIGLFSKLQSLNGINVTGYNRGSPNSHHQTIPSPSPNQHEKQVPNKVSGTPIKFIHSISNTWSIGKMTYYRHKVILKNTSQKPVTDVKLMIENLQGPLWGLSPTPEKNTYELLQWQKVLQPASECTFVYIQGGPQAKISILSYH